MMTTRIYRIKRLSLYCLLSIALIITIVSSIFLYNSLCVGQVIEINTGGVKILYPTGSYQFDRRDLYINQYIVTLVNDRYNLFYQYPIPIEITETITDTVTTLTDYLNR